MKIFFFKSTMKGRIITFKDEFTEYCFFNHICYDIQHRQTEKLCYNNTMIEKLLALLENAKALSDEEQEKIAKEFFSIIANEFTDEYISICISHNKLNIPDYPINKYDEYFICDYGNIYFYDIDYDINHNPYMHTISIDRKLKISDVISLLKTILNRLYLEYTEY